MVSLLIYMLGVLPGAVALGRGDTRNPRRSH